jgi:Tol biopolymer transport system component
VTRPLSGAPELILIPVEAGGVRRLPTSAGNVSSPSFAGSSTLLFVRSEKGTREVWTMETDGSGARSLGGAGCDMPVASPSGSSYLCVQGERRRSLFLFSIKGGPGRKLCEIPNEGGFIYARWNRAGDRILAVTRNRRLLTLDSSTGTLLQDEAIPLAGTTGQANLIAAALDAEAATGAYSVIRTSSDLYLASGIR